jgi:hypothetical protein
MAGNTHEWVRWAFDGAGGGAVLSLIGWLVHRGKSAPRVHHVTKSSNIVDTDSQTNSLAVGTGVSLHGSHLVVGSNNTINVSSPQDPSRKTMREGGKGLKTEIVTHLGVVISALVVTVGAAYFSYRVTGQSWVAAFAKPPVPITDIGVAFGNRIPEDSFDAVEEESCITKGVTCLGEANIKGKIIHVPLQEGESWARIAVLVTTYNVSEGVEDPHIVVSTSSAGVGLNYPDHRDGLLHGQIEFTPNLLHSTSYYRRPDSFSVDITFGSHVGSFPLTIAVWGDGLPRRAVTTQVRLLPHNDAADHAVRR